MPEALTEEPLLTGERYGRRGHVQLGSPAAASSPATPGSGPRTDTDEGARTTEPSLDAPATGRLCVQVALVRNGVASPAADTCVE